MQPFIHMVRATKMFLQSIKKLISPQLFPISPFLAYVWPVDMFDPCHCAFEVESVAAVSTRLRETILKIEDSNIHKEGGDMIVLTSHADVLQILQVYASGAKNVCHNIIIHAQCA